MGNETSKWFGEEFEQIAQVIRQANTDIDGHLNTLEGYVEGQMADWIGESRTAYYEHKKAWDAAILEMNRILNENAVPTLGNVHMNYSTNETKMSRAWAV